MPPWGDKEASGVTVDLFTDYWPLDTQGKCVNFYFGVRDRDPLWHANESISGDFLFEFGYSESLTEVHHLITLVSLTLFLSKCSPAWLLYYIWWRKSIQDSSLYLESPLHWDSWMVYSEKHSVKGQSHYALWHKMIPSEVIDWINKVLLLNEKYQFVQQINHTVKYNSNYN